MANLSHSANPVRDAMAELQTSADRRRMYLELWADAERGPYCISATRLDGKGRMPAIEIRPGSPRNLARAALELAIHLEADR